MYGPRTAVVLLTVLLFAPAARAGLYYSGETVADLPSQWRGFLVDQRALRQIAVPAAPARAASPARQRYEDAAAALEKAARARKLTADEQADLGALYVRLGEPARAVEVLRAAHREHPQHFRIAANLGTAWQLQGDLDQAAQALQEAVRLAPGKLEKAEEYQLKLVRLRQREPKGAQDLDNLFGVRYGGEPGKLPAAERKKLPADAAAVLQQLALWLPADGRLLWQLAELASAHGDVKTAAAILDGCVTEFGMSSPELRRRRQLMRAAADELAKQVDAAKAAHEEHAGGIKPRSRRPLVNKLDATELPPISATGVNAVPWAVFAETTVDRRYQPAFSKYLKELDGKRVALSGFMQPLNEDLEHNSFMLIEYPVGCWYCETPEITGIVLVELPASKTAHLTRSLIKVTGKLTLNATDPENFLYTLRDAKVAEAD
jgi:Tfp pilus assembly protein PilF